VNARTAVIGALPALPEEPLIAARSPAAPARHQRVYLDSWQEVPLYRFEALAPGQQFDGPALVEGETTAALIGPRDRARVTPHGWLDIEVL
jgi:N-methylhydantoinase A/oxoprolinase/acetone carboxylase beta subunit